MVVETHEDYGLASAEAGYENTGEYSPMGFMVLGGEILGLENIPPRMDRKRSSIPSLNGTGNSKWETAAVCMSVNQESIIKATCRFKTPLEYWGCINPSKISCVQVTH